MTGNGKWREPGVPHKGWRCTGMTDLEEPSAVCEMCEVREIRFVHNMEHDCHPPLNCGCVCAGHMEQDLDGARDREKDFRKRLAREKTAQRKQERAEEKCREDWLRRWGVSGNGNPVKSDGGYVMTVYPKNGAWRFSVRQPDGTVRFWPGGYETAAEAKAVLFAARHKTTSEGSDA